MFPFSSAPLVYPDFDPVALHLGLFDIRWYALAYLTGFLLGYGLALRLGRFAAVRYGRPFKDDDFGDFLTWGVLGVVIGGRLGYVLFYNLQHYLDHPLDIPQVWHGGMSFHGGLLGMVVAAILFTRRNKLDTLAFGDILVCVSTVGLGLGRLANFINGELVGRPVETSGLPWAMIFPRVDQTPRHPSQLYEAGLEGLLLLLIMLGLTMIPSVRRRPGVRLGLFLLCYAVFRAIAECFRTPDTQLGYLVGGATMGQLLCIPMGLIGIVLAVWAARRPPVISSPAEIVSEAVATHDGPY